jgi:hypothetical protein
MGPLLGARARRTPQTGHALPQRVIAARAVRGLPGLLRARFLALRQALPCRGGGLIRLPRGRRTGASGAPGPPLLGPGTPALPPLQREALAWRGRHGQPAPWRLGLRRHAPPPGLGGGFQPSPAHGGGTRWPRALAVRGTGGTACPPTGPPPRQRDAHGPTKTTPREARTPQGGHPRARRGHKERVCRRGPTLAGAGLTGLRLCAGAGMAGGLVPW